MGDLYEFICNFSTVCFRVTFVLGVGWGEGLQYDVFNNSKFLYDSLHQRAKECPSYVFCPYCLPPFVYARFKDWSCQLAYKVTSVAELTAGDIIFKKTSGCVSGCCVPIAGTSSTYLKDLSAITRAVMYFWHLRSEMQFTARRWKVPNSLFIGSDTFDMFGTHELFELSPNNNAVS